MGALCMQFRAATRVCDWLSSHPIMALYFACVIVFVIGGWFARVPKAE